MKVKNMNKKLNEIIEQIRSLRKEIKEKYKAEVIGIFGSYVRGEETKKSGLDVLVKFYDGATLFDLVGLTLFRDEKLGIKKVDVVSERALQPEIEKYIQEEVVYI